jgi:RES domain-containing protein
VVLYRVAPEKYALDLSGEGARLAGGRWNPKLRPALYTSEHPSLALTETLPSFSLEILPLALCLVTLTVADDISILNITCEDLPPDWNAYPPPASTVAMGKRWLTQGEYAALKVPSTRGPVGKCWNFVLNPLHPELSGKMTAAKERWVLDARLERLCQDHIL